MALSISEFAAAFEALRPLLKRSACQLRRCGEEDAEDLVSEVAVIAIELLPEYDEETGASGLRNWLKGILQRVVQRDYRNMRTRVSTVPIAEAADVPASDTDELAFDRSVQSLPRGHRQIVADWLAGYSQDEIAQRNRIHRNTVAIRLEESFASLRVALPDAEALIFSFALFAVCSRPTIYRKPREPWLPWRLQHPPEPRIRRTPRHKPPDEDNS